MFLLVLLLHTSTAATLSATLAADLTAKTELLSSALGHSAKYERPSGAIGESANQETPSAKDNALVRFIDGNINIGPFSISPKEYAKQLVNLGEKLLKVSMPLIRMLKLFFISLVSNLLFFCSSVGVVGICGPPSPHPADLLVVCKSDLLVVIQLIF